MYRLLDQIESLVWGAPLILLLSLVGVYLTILLKGIQFRYLLYSFKLVFTKSDDKSKGDISRFESLMTSLAATLGIGSIGGVATAVSAGGIGALFWMWIAALYGMATMYSESVLAIKYRTIDEKGQMCGGPMIYLEKGLGIKWLAIFFSIFGIGASFGIGNVVQAHAISSAIHNVFHIDFVWTGIFLSFFIGLVILKGIKSIGKISSITVPLMGTLYVSGGLWIIISKADLLPEVFYQIFVSAFTGQAAVGGFLGSSIMLAMQYGVSRGVFSTEAGMGSAPIAAAAARTDVPSRQALVSMCGVFITAFIICTITGLVIALTGFLGKIGPDGQMLNGSVLVLNAFESIITGGGVIVTISLILFGYSTIMAWSYYGEKCIEYLFGIKAVLGYRIFFIILLIPGSMMSMEVVWSFANIMNGLMAFPNLIGLIGLSKVVSLETKSFIKLLKKESSA